jgi:hypothetical protein
VIRGACIGYSEADRNAVQKPDVVALGRPGGKIIANAENEFVWPSLQLLRCKQWLIGAAIIVCANGFQKSRRRISEGPKLDLHVARRTAIGSVEDVGA